MRRYFELVKDLDNGKITIEEFVKRVTGAGTINEYQATAAYLVYLEDGGRKYKPEDFDRVITHREEPTNTVSKLMKLVKEGVE